MLFPAHDVYHTVKKKNRTNDIDYQKKDYLCNRIFKSTLTHYGYSFTFISICIYPVVLLKEKMDHPHPLCKSDTILNNISNKKT